MSTQAGPGWVGGAADGYPGPMTYEETTRTTPGRPSPASDAPAGPTSQIEPRPEHRDEQSVRYEGVGIAAGFIALVVAAAAVLVVVGQNVERVPFEFLWWEADVPLAVLLLATALAALVLGELVG
jgi:uncharacterized integral membrane protein